MSVSEQPSVSIIVPTARADDNLRWCLSSIVAAHPASDELLVLAASGEGDEGGGGTKREAAPRGGFCEVKAVFAYLRRRKINIAAAPRPNSAKLPGSGMK